MSILDKVYVEEAKIAHDILLPFRELDGGIVTVTIQRADRLEQAICEALVAMRKIPDAKGNESIKP